MQSVKNQETQPDALFTGGEETKTRENQNHPDVFFSGEKKTSRENHLDIFWRAQNQLENITQMHFSGGEKSI